MYKYILFFCLSIFSFLSYSQSHTYSGKVIDAQSGEPLPFVNILFGAKNQGVTTDINGKFLIKAIRAVDSLVCSYIGYHNQTFRGFSIKSGIVISMNKKVFELKEFLVTPVENPAHRIINAAIKNRDNNNPLKNSSFSYTSYNKMVFTSTVFQDSSALRAYADTTLQDSVSKMKRRTVKFFTDQHLFMMESVNKRIFKAPNKNYEKVLASKISGFKDPLFTLLITQVQSVSFYDDLFLLLDKKFVNPISSGSPSKYFFEIQDTTYRDNDTVFIISFRPRKGTTFDGLKGHLYINTRGYAIQNVIAEPAKKEGGFSISIQQQYELVGGEKWFPVQLNTNFYFNAIVANGYKILGNGTTFIQDIKLNNPIKNKEFGDAEVDLDVISPENSNQLLVQYRRDTLTPQEIKTYLVIDSIGKKENFEKWMNYSKTLMTGKIPMGYVDLDISNFIRFNDYEGWRLDLGLYTNRRLMRNFTLGGFFAYGFSDMYSKYRLEAVWNINREKNTTLTVAYKDDIIESGGQPLFYDQKNFFDGDFMRRSFVTRFDRTEKFEVAATHRFFRYLTTRLELNTQTKTPMYQVLPIVITQDLVSKFNSKSHLTESVISFRYAFKEKFVKNGDWLFSMGTDYPIVTAQYIHGFNNLLNSNYEYNRVEAKIFKSFQYKYIGKSTVQISAGISDRLLPLWGNFVAKSCNNDISLFCDNAFQSIKINSFVSDRYLSVFLKHNFGKRFLQSRRFKPEISLHQNILYGDLKYNNYLYQYRYKTPKSGYFETGLMINKLLDLKTSAFGVGVFCNYGKYADINFKNNFTFLWNISLPIE
ncbi:MAG: DUF5686 family protein [Bacteroidota bacterium]